MFDKQSSASIRTAAAALALALAPAAVVGCAGRGLDAAEPFVDDRIPIADAYLDRAYTDHAGLLTAIGPDGTPVTDGPAADPLIAESRLFYETLGAPLTLDAWKGAFGFPARAPGESVRAWRARAGVVIYYNRNELGLGRELGCAEFSDGTAPNGSPLTGVACFVTNYGVVFDDESGSLADAVEGTHPRNTVCITYRPSLGPNYEVQFYTYAGDGRRIEWAQLDTLGPRPHPEVCMNCHGGGYDETRHLARGARFLPLDPGWLAFSDDAAYTRPAQEERIRQLNVLSLSTPLTPAQIDFVTGMYGGAPGDVGRSAMPWVPTGWQATQADADLFIQVVRPYCGTCHLAIETSASGVESGMFKGLRSRDDMARAALVPYLCSFQMPNAQPTMAGLWRTSGVDVGGVSFASGADALLAAFAGGGRPLCTELSRFADCRRGPDPDALCGDAHSGTACDRDTGLCVSAGRTLAATSGLTSSTGVCRMDGSRTCPHSMQCQPENTGLSGYDGACYGCGRLGEPPCAQSPACDPGLAPDGTGACAPAP